jgi:hypothetical protein
MMKRPYRSEKVRKANEQRAAARKELFRERARKARAAAEAAEVEQAIQPPRFPKEEIEEELTDEGV